MTKGAGSRPYGGQPGGAVGAGAPGAALGTVAARASRDADGTSAKFLDGYLELLVDVSSTGRLVNADERDSRRALGARAAEGGVALRAVIDLYLSATWMSWPRLPGVQRANTMGELRSVSEAILRAVDGAVVALAEGYEAAQRLAIRQEEALRREFVDDLLHGRGDMGLLAERAERFGIRLAGANVVVVVQAAAPFKPEDPAARYLEAALLARFTSENVLLATKDGLLVCVAPVTREDTSSEFVRQLRTALGTDLDWRVGVGRPHPGPGGVVRSYEEAKGSLDLAARLGIGTPLVQASDLLVFPVLLRDSAAMTDLVTAVLGPLQRARGGARPLLDTLAAYFSCGGVSTETARRLHVGVRTVSYRLDRIHDLTGYSTDDAIERYTLETAVLGARLLGWPDHATSASATP
jgi:hypothetical protein